MKSAIAQQVETPSAWTAISDTLGWVCYQKGAYKYSIGLFEEALKLGERNGPPDSPRVHYHLGMASAKTGQATLARQQFQQAVKINPNSNEGADAKKQLAQLRS